MGAGSVAAAGSFGAMLLCALLDYILAYAAIGLSGPVAGLFTRAGAGADQGGESGASKKTRGINYPMAGLIAGITATGLLRLFCSFLSGVLIWGAWAPEGVPVWQYSLAYNAGWCLPDVAIALFAAIALSLAPGMQTLYLSGRPVSRPAARSDAR
jgi:thiamine transporter